jgi:endoglucanase
VGINGSLSVVNGRLVNQYGHPIQLRGMSTHGLQWFEYLITDGYVRTLAEDWGGDVLRIAMYTDQDGYINNPVEIAQQVDRLVELTGKYGIYTIIDWHILFDGDPNEHKAEALAFWSDMVPRHGSKPHVLFEICNEPNGQGVTWESVKSFAEEVVPHIRGMDEDNIIIVGTQDFSSRPDLAADDPLTGFDNIMYTLHFYAGSHGQEYRDRIMYAMSKGIGVFVSEWGTAEAHGGGGIDEAETRTWMEFLHEHRISWCNWTLSTAGESTAALLGNASAQGDWPDEVISESGKLVRSYIQNPPDSFPTEPAVIIQKQSNMSNAAYIEFRDALGRSLRTDGVYFSPQTRTLGRARPSLLLFRRVYFN